VAPAVIVSVTSMAAPVISVSLVGLK